MKDSIAVVFVVILFLCAIFTGSSPLGTAQQTSSDWPMFRTDLSHSGVGTGNPVLSANLLWNNSVGGQIYSSPAVVDGVVYIGSLKDRKSVV